jgi:hypothetical protein
MRAKFVLGLLATGAVAMAACGSSGTTAAVTSPATTTTSGSGSGVTTSAMYSQFGSSVQVTIDGATVTLRTTDQPDHPSPYWPTSNPLYEAPHAGMMRNPFSIVAQNIVMRVPLSPQVATQGSDTPLGPIGVSINGVVFFNQYAAGRVPLGDEIYSFDRLNGHPAPSNQYHYHMEPLWLTATSKSRLIGVLLDGFPVYGPRDMDGTAPANLDVCHGHVGATSEFPDGLYHYHTTDTSPYVSGCYRGAPGTIG